MVNVTGVAHIGIRVADAARAEAFYAKLGFRAVAHDDKDPVVILENDAGIEINLIVNADPAADGTNVLMDVPGKRAGYTHVALAVASMPDTQRALADAGIAVSDGPVKLGARLSLFVRDPDRNVIELREAG